MGNNEIRVLLNDDGTYTLTSDCWGEGCDFHGSLTAKDSKEISTKIEELVSMKDKVMAKKKFAPAEVKDVKGYMGGKKCGCGKCAEDEEGDSEE